jgi:mono/diheme cytochrome c family protein
MAIVLVAAALGWGCDTLFPKRSEGEKLYRKYCADCHGIDGSGDTIRYMGNSKADLLDNSWKHGGDATSMFFVLRDEVVFRHPSYDDLSDKQLQLIVKYVLQLRGEDSGP